MYKYIRDPISKRKISIKSDQGIKILSNYLNLLGGAQGLSTSSSSSGRTMNHAKISKEDKINVGTPREIESVEAEWVEPEWNPSHVKHTVKTKLNAKDTKNIITKLKNEIPECCKINVSYYDVLQRLSENWKQPIYIVGGAVRDYMMTKDVSTMNDIDINYTTTPDKVVNLLTDLQITEWHMDSRNYIRVGPKAREDYLEGFHINPYVYEDKKHELECKMNSLAFLIENEDVYLIDFFGGEALDHAINKIWASPTNDYQEWLKYQEKLLWRLLKFELRGYTVPEATKYQVYSWFINSPDKIPIYRWENLWWTVHPDKLDKVVDLIERDCLEVGLNPMTLIKNMVNKKVLIGNKK